MTDLERRRLYETLSCRPVSGTVPWPPDAVTEDFLEDQDIDRLNVFVPAIMSVGLVFSIATLVRDAFRWSGDRARERRTTIQARSVVSQLVGEHDADPRDLGFLSRPTYLLTALVLVGGAAYIAIGSTANFVRDGGYVRDIGWLLAVSLGLAVITGFLGGVSFVVFLFWPDPPAWTFGPLRTAPLTVTPGRAGLGPSWSLTAALVAGGVSLMMLTLIVGSGRSVAMDIDRPIAQWLVETEWLDRLGVIDLFGKTVISIAFVGLIGLSGFRCRVMALSFPIGFLLGWGAAAVIGEVVERPRPVHPGDLQSFPSGHLVQAAFIAGLVPLAVTVLFSSRRAASLSRAGLGAAVIATALHRIHDQNHWPLDALAGATLGLTVVLGIYWVMAHRSLHRHCGSCPWSANPASVTWRKGVWKLDDRTAKRLDVLGSVAAISAALALVVATRFLGLPTDPEGYGFGSQISGPVQLALAGLVAVFGLVALRWRAVGAVGIAFAGTGLGLFASVQYRPLLAVTLTTSLLVPAVIIWLSWQRKETVGRIAGLAAFTAGLLTATAVGSSQIYNYYFGPTHPESSAEGLESDEADWLWLGAVDPRSATVVAGGVDEDKILELRFWPADDVDSIQAVAATGVNQDSARFQLTGLDPSTRYRYAVTEVGSGLGSPQGDAGFKTPAAGPQDLAVVLGACARSGSNGAVFDAIVAEDPDLYVALGDMHYANLSSTDPADHAREYGRALTQPGQAALFGSVPTAYVWDDHDYGPNDSDSSSESRLAVSTAYREAVPNYGVDPNPEAPISQAFTLGRVRFVISDTRSQRTDSSMLGPQQLAWLIEELTSAASTHALVVWVNPTPWIGPADSGTDDWSSYADERQTIADGLAAASVQNLIMVSGDAHMVGIDDGTNSGYATDGSPGFPVLHAAALDRPGSTKGGPYSHGAFPGSGQYGKLEIDDDGGQTITVRMSGHDWQRTEIVSLELEFQVPTSP